MTDESLPPRVRGLLDRAAANLSAGDILGARQLLDQAAVAAEQEGLASAAGRARLSAAASCRLAGDPAGAAVRLTAAAAALGADAPLVAMESAMQALAQGKPAAGREALTAALTETVDEPLVRADLLRLRGRLAAVSGDIAEASADLDLAVDAYRSAGRGAVADRLEVERAAIVSVSVIEDPHLIKRLDARGDVSALADLGLVRVARALEEGDAGAARVAATDARQLALDSVNPAAYLGSTLALATIADREGDRLGAYTALATGLATLSDAVGLETATALVQPELIRLRDRWGTDAFAQVKHDHDERRKSATGRS